MESILPSVLIYGPGALMATRSFFETLPTLRVNRLIVWDTETTPVAGSDHKFLASRSADFTLETGVSSVQSLFDGLVENGVQLHLRGRVQEQRITFEIVEGE